MLSKNLQLSYFAQQPHYLIPNKSKLEALKKI